MKTLKIIDSNLKARVDVEIKENEKVIIKGERAYIVNKEYVNIENIEQDLEIESPYQLEGTFESFIIE